MSISTIYSRLDRELYLKYLLKHPSFYPFLARLALRRVLDKGSGNGHAVDPLAKFNTPERREILAEVQAIHRLRFAPERLLQLPSLRLPITEDARPPQKIAIPLATRTVPLDRHIFDASYVDVEDLFAANRFIWLFALLADHPSKKELSAALEMILVWVESYPAPDGHSRFESYSICERVVAWLFFLMFTGDHVQPRAQQAAGIAQSIQRQIEHLIRNLEYHGDATNNHILNNARALYIAGRLLHLDAAALLGRKIFLAEHERVFRQGVYQEGSSHYQFLLTKNLMETQMVAHLTGDGEFEQTLRPIVCAMLRTCRALQPGRLQELPLFGDISPDMAPDWFVGYPFCPDRSSPSKWFRLFHYAPDSCDEPDSLAENVSQNSRTVWRHLSAGRFDVWVNLRHGGIPGHGHNDNGAIIVFHEDRPVIVDPGLASYRQTASDLLQVSACGHNVPVIDGFEPDIPKDSALSRSRLSSTFEVLADASHRIEYAVTYANRHIRLVRSVALTPDACTVTDRLSSPASECVYEVNWHCDGWIEAAPDHSFLTNGLWLSLECGGKRGGRPRQTHQRSVSYGRKRGVHTLHFCDEICADARVIFTLSRSQDGARG